MATFEVVITPGFQRAAKPLLKRYASLRAELLALAETLETTPLHGEPLGQDCYKLRMAIRAKGQGKRGGARVITCVKVVAHTCYVLTIYDKSDRDDLVPGELNALLAAAGLG